MVTLRHDAPTDLDETRAGSEGTASRPAGRSAADILRPLTELLFRRPLKVRLQLWDGSSLGPDEVDEQIRITTPDVVRRILWAPGELGIGRAFVLGEIEIDGDISTVLKLLRDAAGGESRVPLSALPRAFRAALELGVVGASPPPPPEETRLVGLVHSLRRDRRAISHHYDLSNDFYRLVLGPSMTYSCGRFVGEGATLEDAQSAKHDLVCRKLGLADRPGARLLDVGCGWGSMAIHAALHHGAEVVGVTLSRHQAALAQQRVEEAGLSDKVTIRVLDYRQLSGEQFDAISSIGMFEHVGRAHMDAYFSTLHGLLRREGRLLNHAISTPGGSRMKGRSFMHRYVFPDGEVIDVGEVVLAMERAGFEVRDVESLREHYARTLGAWTANLRGQWDRAIELVGERRARVWWLYMSGSINGFEDGGLAIHQALGVVPGPEGTSGMPPTRRAFERSATT